ncbi:MAG: hypothetical protein HOC05_06325 [Gemmatimonadetes bacterium]|nr:hypothetical protein [Gemmatimonadota bacterium]MBT4609634.1 hypothetical protein [Gemmatimonadota bacterium]MBT5145319.1 hypothetical protein [Gemmatimonadota bacterium]MBT5587509.1 hypothetical protein [Gemmatimonadota bacterium]MBT5962450.1 hypothetical protein [Gemmatimonadota bacterium]
MRALADECADALESIVQEGGEQTQRPGGGLAVLMDFLLPLKDKQISLAHPKAHFRRVFEITGMAQDFRILEAA